PPFGAQGGVQGPPGRLFDGQGGPPPFAQGATGQGGAPRQVGGPGGTAGGLLNASTPSAALVTMLQANAFSYGWVAATIGANSAAGYQLASNDAIMAIGGFNGTDPTPTLDAFEQLVTSHQIHYFIGGGRGGGPGAGSSSSSSEISTWVAQHFTSQTVGGVTLYDLTAPLATTGTGS
ncbi:MAG: glycosyl transferase, partial [Candidatus Dormibacteria bacterium]